MSMIEAEGISHVRIVESMAAETNHLESGLNVISFSGPKCPLYFLIITWVSVSIIFILKLSSATARNEFSACQLKNDTVSSNFNFDNTSVKNKIIQ